MIEEDMNTRQIFLNFTFFYDAWNLIAEVDAQTGDLIRTYVWGLDLSGTMQGAGGIGGLLWINVEGGSNAGRYFVAYDGNGNVMGLVSADDGSVVAQYECGPFAEPMRATGPAAADNPLRFSTKYTDPETGLLYYGYRYYSPSLGRWLSRDPVGENGGVGLYVIAENNILNKWDRFGLSAVAVPIPVPSISVPALPEAGSVVGGVAGGLAGGAAVAGTAYGGYKLGSYLGEKLGIHEKVGEAIAKAYERCRRIFCRNRHPTWPTCTGESDPALAVWRQAPIYYPGWILYYVEVKKNERRPADPWVCPSGGDWYPVESKFFTVTLSGMVYVDTSLTVACCNCCYTFREGKSCHILHPWKGTGDQEVPKQEPPFRGRNFGIEQ